MLSSLTNIELPQDYNYLALGASQDHYSLGSECTDRYGAIA